MAAWSQGGGDTVRSACGCVEARLAVSFILVGSSQVLVGCWERGVGGRLGLLGCLYLPSATSAAAGGPPLLCCLSLWGTQTSPPATNKNTLHTATITINFVLYFCYYYYYYYSKL